MDIAMLMGGELGTGAARMPAPQDWNAGAEFADADDLADVNFTPALYTQYPGDRRAQQGW